MTEIRATNPAAAAIGRTATGTSPAETEAVEVSVVMPCLNEAETLATCIRKAQGALHESQISGEIIVADNGSTDGSRELARELGARVVDVDERGYGSALMGGIAAARGRFVIMGDADDSYDFGEIPQFVDRLREGFSLVQGCRLPAGGGRILPGAMPVLHRRWGNPMFSRLARWMFGVPVHDVYCGLRGFSRDLYDRLKLRCTGMEFATEMIVKGSLFGADIAEVPITLHPDGRRTREPHLRTFRDGWRTLRFYLVYSPQWIYLIPGLLMILLGIMGYGLALPGVRVLQAQLDVHTLLVASLAILLGFQSLQFGAFAKTFAVTEGILPPRSWLERWCRQTKLEHGLLAGLLAFVAGVALLGSSVYQWWRVDFGALDYARTMRLVIPGTLLSAIGFQTILASFFLSLLNLRRK